MVNNKLKEKLLEYQKFIDKNRHVTDKVFLDFAKEVSQVSMMIEMYESCGECMSFNIKEKEIKLEEMYNSIFDGIETGL